MNWLVLILVVVIIVIIVMCCNKKEGFTGPAQESVSLGGYSRLCRFGPNGIWYDCSRGAGEYIGQGRKYTGFYGDYPTEENLASCPNPYKTPGCMLANCGRFDTPKNVKGCGCLEGPEVCCGKCRGCEMNLLPFFGKYECGEDTSPGPRLI